LLSIFEFVDSSLIFTNVSTSIGQREIEDDSGKNVKEVETEVIEEATPVRGDEVYLFALNNLLMKYQ